MVEKIFIEVLGLEEGRENMNWFLIIQMNSETYSSEFFVEQYLFLAK